MTMICPRKQSTLAWVVWLALGAAPQAEQRPDVQRLFQSGEYAQVVDAARDADPASTYLAVQALMKLEQHDRAAADLARLARSGDDWRFMAESVEALIANDTARAVDRGHRAVAANGENAFGHYQLGLAASKATDWAVAVASFTTSSQLKPDFAYAHYYAALAHQRMRQLSKAADHFDAFLRLAPDAPERSAVVAIMRTLK